MQPMQRTSGHERGRMANLGDLPALRHFELRSLRVVTVLGSEAAQAMRAKPRRVNPVLHEPPVASDPLLARPGAQSTRPGRVTPSLASLVLGCSPFPPFPPSLAPRPPDCTACCLLTADMPVACGL